MPNRGASCAIAWLPSDLPRANVPESARQLVLSFLKRNPITRLELSGIKSFPTAIFTSLPLLRELTLNNTFLDFAELAATWPSLLAALQTTPAPVRLELVKAEFLYYTMPLVAHLIFGPGAPLNLANVTDLTLAFGKSAYPRPTLEVFEYDFRRILGLPTRLERLSVTFPGELLQTPSLSPVYNHH